MAAAWNKEEKTHGFKLIEDDLAKGSFSDVSVALLYGSEPLLVETYENKLKELFVTPAAEMLDFMHFSGEKLNSSAVSESAETFPLFSEKRVILIDDIPGTEQRLASSSYVELATSIEALPSSTFVIISSKGNVAKRSALYKACVKHGKVYEFGKLNKEDARAFIIGRFYKAGAKCDNAIADEIIKISGYLDRETEADLYLVESDVARIAAFAAPEGDLTARYVITRAHVAACMGSSLESDVFIMLDAVCSDKKGEALQILTTITAKNESSFRLLALITDQFEIMLGYMELSQADDKSMAEIAKALGGKNEYRVKKAAGFARNYSVERLTELLHRLYRIEADIKSGLYNERLALQMFIAEM
jgi:DNA polymerase-3 subunit delta